MRPRVVAIWLDGADPEIVEAMMADGRLPALSRLRRRGGFGRIRTIDHSFVEATASMVITGRTPAQTGAWNVQRFCPRTYELLGTASVRQGSADPFYAIGDAFRVAAFDVPFMEIYSGINGLQVSKWGANSHDMPLRSAPEHLGREIVARYGEHPARGGVGFALLEDPDSISGLHDRLLQGLRLREQVTRDLLAREPWDLFITAFNETDPAGHYLFPHRCCRGAFDACGGQDFMRSVYEHADAAVGRLAREAGDDVRFVVFSVEGMRANSDDLPSMVFLPELLFRYSFPGRQAMEFDPRKLSPSPERQAGIIDWVMELWNHRVRAGKPAIWLRERLSPLAAVRAERWLGIAPTLFHPLTDDHFLNHQPLRWYRPYWPRMKAFALPTSSHGLIRLNVRGRERHGRIAPRHFDRACEAITQHLRRLTIPETGGPAVADVVRIRQTPHDAAGEKKQIADLVVKWHPDVGDRIASPDFGMLGPVPMVRTGTHTQAGFLFAAGPGITPGTTFPTGQPVDIAPTILQLMGAPISPTLPGQPLIEPATMPARRLAA